MEICHNVLGVKKVFHKCGKYLLAHTEEVSASGFSHSDLLDEVVTSSLWVESTITKCISKGKASC